MIKAKTAPKAPAKAPAKKTPAKTPDPRPLDVVLMMDSTLSMSSVIEQTKLRMLDTMERMFAINPGIRIAVVTHGDYHDLGDRFAVLGLDDAASVPNLINILDFTGDKKSVMNAIKSAPATHGGDVDEAYEYVYRKLRHLAWRKDDGVDRLVFQFSDASPHSIVESQRQRRSMVKLDWREELQYLSGMRIKVTAIQCLGAGKSSQVNDYYQEIAKTTGGFRFGLDNWQEVVPMIEMGLRFQSQGQEGVEQYANDLRDKGQLSTGLKAASIQYNVGSVSRGGLKGVPAGRFMVIQVPVNCTYRTVGSAHVVKPGCKIEEFVKANGIDYEPGNGYYEWTKKEKLIHGYKKVVVMRRDTSECFEGVKARRLARLPYEDGPDGKIADLVNVSPPPDTLYRYFIESDSMNRVLVPGSHLLYEAKR